MCQASKKYRCLLALLSPIFLACVTLSHAQSISSSDLIIRNVYLTQGGDADNVLVNVLVEDNNVALVSEDRIPAEDGARILDAQEGYLLGSLIVGEPATFIILSQNPVGNITILLDTRPYVVFAMDNGQLIRNVLPEIADNEEGPSTTLGLPRWLAYRPPQVALPTSYESGRKWNAWDTRNFTGVFVSALAVDRQWWSQDEESRNQVGDLSDFERGTIRGFRFGIGGTIKFERPWVYTIAGAANAFDRGFDFEDTDEFEFFDFSVDIPLSERMTLSVGKQKEPINVERTMTMTDLAAQERTATADAMFPTRNFGVVINGTALNQRMSWAGGLFNDWIIEGESFDDSASQVVGRVTWLPFLSDDESNLLHLGVGVRHTDAKQGLHYRSRPETGNAPNFVDTEPFAAKSSTLFNYEASWRKGPYWILAELSDNHIDAPDLGNPRFRGYHLSGTWSLSGEMRPYRKPSGVLTGLPIAQNVRQGGLGALELGVRFSNIDLTDGAIDGGDMNIASVGLNWWLTKEFLISVNFRRTWTERKGFDGQADAIVTRVVLVLQ